MALRAYAREHRFGCWLTLIAGVGLLWRVVYDVKSRHRVVGGDGIRFLYGARLLVDGKGFQNALAYARGVHVPDTGHPPGWTILLAGIVKVGAHTVLQQQVATSILGTATVVMVGLAARQAFGARTALIAAALAAVYPFMWLYERELLSEPLAMLGGATTIWLAYKFLAAPGPGLAVALGAVIGVMAMTKSDQVAIALVLVVPLIMSRRAVDLRRRIAWLASAAVVCVAIMAPWSIYLSSRFDRPVLLTGALGAGMAEGNCKQTYSGTLLGYASPPCDFAVKGKPGDDPFTRDAQLQHRAVDFMRHHESRVPVVVAARIGRTFGFFRPNQQMQFETVRGTSETVFRVGFYAYWALLPFAAIGTVIARRRRVPVYPLLAFPVVVVLMVLPAIGAVRYRAPAEIPLVMLAAVTLDAAIGAWRRPAARQEPVSPNAPESGRAAVGL